MSYELTLAERVTRLERIVIALADATAAWEGGSYDGGHYVAARWKDRLREAVKELTTLDLRALNK